MAQRVKNLCAMNAGDLGLIPGLGRCLEEGSDNPLQYSCLENPMDREAWQAKQSMWLQNSLCGCKTVYVVTELLTL